MMDLHRDRVQCQQLADLVEGHTLLLKHRARQNRLAPPVKEVVLREGVIRLVLRGRGRRDLECIEHHDDTGDAAKGLVLLGQEVDAKRDEGLEAVAFQEQPLPGLRPEVDQVLRERKRLGVGACRKEA